jgi:outer membrane protein assembly factor BamA
MRLWPVTVLLALITAPALVAQQDTQGQVQGQNPNGPAQAVAAATALPPQDEPGFVEKAKNWAQDHQLMERLNGDIDGWYPRLGGMTRGGGFAFGPGYRVHWNDVLVDLSFGYSTKAYKAADIKVRWLQAFDKRFELWTNYRYEDFPQEDYFGPGLTSLKTNRTSYDFDSQQIRALALFKPVPWLHLGTDLGYITPDIGEGTDRNYPSIEEIFSDPQAPGLIEQPRYLHTTFFADIDYRDQPGRPRNGGFYHVAMGFWNDRTLERYDFKRFDAGFSQFVPLDPDKKHVVLGRVGVAYVNNETGSRVPFYFLPYVGGVDTIRSFHEFRFRDENALWLTGEYNLTLMKWVSVAAFIDAGKVAPDWQDINLTGLKHGYGFGVRVHSNHQTFARIDVGTGGGEGSRLFLKLGSAF